MAQEVEISTLEVRTDKWKETRLVRESLSTALAPDEVLLRIDRQALTANNISYAFSGDSLGYWKFFPAQSGWGRIPAMGWADVCASVHPDVRVGERVWGFFPFSTHLKIVAGRNSAAQFHDVAAHRAGLAPIYAQFDRAATNPLYEAGREDQDSLLRGLFMTSWLVEDFLQQNAAFAAGACLITSASSKTSIALGHCVKQRAVLQCIGLTSRANTAFCEALGCYDRVLAYEDIPTLDSAQPVVMVDMAGSAELLSRLHHHFGDNMKYSCQVGATHHAQTGATGSLPGAKPEFFFAPSQVRVRSTELGATELMMRMGMAYVAFRKFCDSWLRIERSHGPEAFARVYQTVLAGSSDPASGQIVSMWSEQST